MGTIIFVTKQVILLHSDLETLIYAISAYICIDVKSMFLSPLGPDDKSYFLSENSNTHATGSGPSRSQGSNSATPAPTNSATSAPNNAGPANNVAAPNNNAAAAAPTFGPAHSDWNVAREIAVREANGATVSAGERARIQEAYDRYHDRIFEESNPIDINSLTDIQVSWYLNQFVVAHGMQVPEYAEHPITGNIVKFNTVYMFNPITEEIIRKYYPGGRPTF